MLKLGQIYLNRGVWNGQRILDESWVEAASAPQSSINEPDDYGYGWWRIRYDIEGRKIDAIYASGNGGQLLIVVPELELVTLFHGGNYSDYRTWSQFRDRTMSEFVLPAAIAAERKRMP